MKLSEMKKPASAPPEEKSTQEAPATTKSSRKPPKFQVSKPKESAPEPAKEVQRVAGVQIKDVASPAEVAQTTAEVKIQRVEWFDDRYYFCQFPDGSSDRYPSSTHILGIVNNKQLVKWQVEVGAEEASRRLHQAGDRGTRIHHGCEILTAGGLVVYNPFNRPIYTPLEISNMRDAFAEKGGFMVMEDQNEYWQVSKFKEWIRIVDPGVLETERMLCSRTFGYAGTLDYLLDIKEGSYSINGRTPLELPGGIYLTDIKSSNSLHDTYDLQVASYAFAYEEMFPELAGKIVGGLIIHTNAQTRTGIEGLATVYIPREKMLADFEHFKSALDVWKWHNPTEKPTIRDFPSVLSLTIK